MQPTQSTQDAESPQFGFIGEHVQWLRRTWSEGGVGTKIGLACLIAGECLLGVATVFGWPVLGIAFYELHRQNSIPLKDRNVTTLDPQSTSQTNDISKVGVNRLKDSKEKPASEKPPLNQSPRELSPSREEISPNNKKPMVSGFPPTSPTSSVPSEIPTNSTSSVPSVEIATAPPPFQMDKFMDAIRKGKLEKVREFFEKYEINLTEKDKNGLTPLHLAASLGHADIVKVLLEKNASLDSVDSNGDTPLHLAAKAGKIDVVKFLIDEKNVSLDSKNNDGDTPLHLAAFGGKIDVVKFLIDEKNVSLDSKNNNRDTPLHLAVFEGKIDCVKFLLEKKAPIDVKNYQNRTPFYSALYTYDFKTIHSLIRAFLDTHPDLINTQDENSDTVLHLVAISSATDREFTINYLLSKGASITISNKQGDTPLHNAIKAQYDFGDKIPLLLLEKGASLEAKNNKGETPLHTAASHNKTSVFNSLLAKGASTQCKDNEGNILFSSAAQHGSLGIAKILLQKTPELIDHPNTAGLTPLQLAAKCQSFSNRSEMMKFLIQNNANVDQNIEGELLIHWAFQTKDCSEVLNEIIERTKKLNEPDKMGYTVLGKAARDGKLPLVEKLLGKKALVDHGKLTPLQLAAEQHSSIDRSKIILHLINEGKANVNRTVKGDPFIHWAYDNNRNIFNTSLPLVSNINVTNKEGYSLLGKAASKAQLDDVSLLVKKEADIKIGRNAQTPLQLAAEYFSGTHSSRANEIINLLIKNGADVDKNPIRIHDEEEPFIHWAYSNPSCNDTLKLVLDRTKNINVLDSQNYSVLGKAAKVANVDIVKLFVEKGADVNIGKEKDREGSRIKDNAQRSPLQLAVDYFSSISGSSRSRGANEIINLLIEKGADVDNISGRIGNKKEPLIHWVYKEKLKDSLKLVIKFCHKIDAPNTDGKTLLDTAIKLHKDSSFGSNGEMISLLIEKDADITKVTSLGKNETLFQWASKTEARKPILEALIKKGINN